MPILMYIAMWSCVLGMTSSLAVPAESRTALPRPSRSPDPLMQ
jgi:hypothetical protein